MLIGIRCSDGTTLTVRILCVEKYRLTEEYWFVCCECRQWGGEDSTDMENWTVDWQSLTGAAVSRCVSLVALMGIMEGMLTLNCRATES